MKVGSQASGRKKCSRRYKAAGIGEHSALGTAEERQASIAVLLVLMMFPALVQAIVVPLPTVPVLALISVTVGIGRLRVHDGRLLIHAWRSRVFDYGSRFKHDGWRRFIHGNGARRTGAILRREIARTTRPPRSKLRCSEIPGRCSAVIERRGRHVAGDLSAGNRSSTRRSRRWRCATTGRRHLSLWRCGSGDPERLPHARHKVRRPIPAFLGHAAARFARPPCNWPPCSRTPGRCRAALGRSGRRRSGECGMGDCASRRCG